MKDALISLVPNSCFGYSLQTGCKLIAIFQTIFAVIIFGLCIHRLSFASNDAGERSLLSSTSTGIFALVQILYFLIAGALFEGSKQRNLNKCKTWFGVSSLLTLASSVFLLYCIWDISNKVGVGLGGFCSSPLLTVGVVATLANLIFLWTTLGFLHLLHQEGTDIYNT